MSTLPSPASIALSAAPVVPADAQDLNVLCPPDKPVLFGSPAVVYVIPGDMPMDLYIMAQQALMADDEVSGTTLLHQALVGVLGYNIPDTDTEAKQVINRQVRKLGVRTMMDIVNNLYKDDPEEVEGAVEPDPTVLEVSVPTTTTTNSSPQE